MAAQVSNRQALLEGAIRCISERDYSEVTTREIAAAASANVASIRYHFGSKDALVAEALAEGFRRSLAEFMLAASKSTSEDPKARVHAALQTLEERLERQRGLASAFVSALSHAVHNEELRATLSQLFAEMRSGFASYLGLDHDGLGELRASLFIAAFDGLLIQWLLDPEQGRRSLAQLPALLETMPDDALPRPYEV
jgi:AcrR family transcriptional regulator